MTGRALEFLHFGGALESVIESRQGRLAVAQHGSALSDAEPNAGLPSKPMGVPLGTAEFYVSQLSVLGRRDRERSLGRYPTSGGNQNITSGSAWKRNSRDYWRLTESRKNDSAVPNGTRLVWKLTQHWIRRLTAPNHAGLLSDVPFGDLTP
jgi:hypothetical protein